MKLLVLMMLATVLASCSCNGNAEREPPPSTTKLAEPGDVIGEDLMLALAQAKNLHHKAQVYLSDGNPLAAIEAVRKILSLRFPPGAPEADDVRNDARAMLAKQLIRQNQLDDAMRVVDEGLAASTRESFFVANLHTVQGEIHEERAKQLDAEGNKAKATEERHDAIDAFDKAIKIDDTLQKHLVEER
jgi:tetratricopeptide (TPR) repeat protein